MGDSGTNQQRATEGLLRYTTKETLTELKILCNKIEVDHPWRSASRKPIQPPVGSFTPAELKTKREDQKQSDVEEKDFGKQYDNMKTWKNCNTSVMKYLEM